ncbi:hypothetical protein THIAE_09645 [Thiomicrospira aerophila AL3]|uniref:Sce7726 family protein n=1 Tax=Thiomicrospira aerophila AL3 TaxID=717772 RepID=W0DYP7_9GAMM|nr:sce7726 family protein [Thiomicrospira aerophila]AHF02393.1 hypothetical protein THIAE_09645 [Thiomicrospira aerophila AL3]
MKEPFIKAALIDYLIEKYGDTLKVINPEFRFADGNRRADILCISELLEGFEIKSDFDSLSTLAGQIANYLECFESVSIVTTQKHLNGVIGICPENVGVFLIKDSKIQVYRQAKVEKKLSKLSLLKMIGVKEVKSVLREKKVYCKNLMSLGIKDARELLVRNITINEALELVKKTVINKYSSNFNQFLKDRGHVTLIDDIQLLNMANGELAIEE